MFKFHYIILLCFFFISCEKKQQNKIAVNQTLNNEKIKDYIDFKYDKVVAFASVNPMDYYGDDFDSKIDVNKFKDTISRNLNSEQIIKLNNILSVKNNKSSEVHSVADCFYPRHNIIFLLQGKIINHIAVCFECNEIKSSKKTFANMSDMEVFFNSLGLKVFYNPLEHIKYYDSVKISDK